MKVSFWFHACARQVVRWIQWNGPIWSLSTGWEQEWMKAWEALAGHPQLMSAILWNKSYCWLLCNLPRALPLYNALQQTAIKLLLCFFPLLSWREPCRAKVWCIFASRNQFLGNKAPHVDCLSPEYVRPDWGREEGIRAAKKCSRSKNINCNVLCGSREILLEWVYHGKIDKKYFQKSKLKYLDISVFQVLLQMTNSFEIFHQNHQSYQKCQKCQKYQKCQTYQKC